MRNGGADIKSEQKGTKVKKSDSKVKVKSKVIASMFWRQMHVVMMMDGHTRQLGDEGRQAEHVAPALEGFGICRAKNSEVRVMMNDDE